MPARLVPLNEGAAPTVLLQRPVLLIGRHPECDARIDLPQISRRHCCVALAYDRLLIRDLGSTNGVRVNGRVIDEARIFPGDEIAIAQILFRLEDPTPAPAPPKAAPPSKSSPPKSAPPKPSQKPASLPDLSEDDFDLIPLDDDSF